MRKKIFQSFNNKINSYVKMEKLPSGRVKILDVKQKNSKTPFKGVEFKK